MPGKPPACERSRFSRYDVPSRLPAGSCRGPGRAERYLVARSESSICVWTATMSHGALTSLGSKPARHAIPPASRRSSVTNPSHMTRRAPGTRRRPWLWWDRSSRAHPPIPRPHPIRSVTMERGTLSEAEGHRLVAGSLWIDHDLVFPSPVGTPLDASNVRKYFQEVCANAGVRPRRVHDWRVTAASWLADLNVHPDTARRVTRHSQNSTILDYYTKSSSEPRRGRGPRSALQRVIGCQR
jgi:hypothetical protein